MLEMKRTGSVQAKGSIRVLKLNRETLRELGGEPSGTGFTRQGFTCRCTRPNQCK